MRIYFTILAGLLGLAFGSFLNVCLSRWPSGESVVRPSSHCRACGRTLSWWENVPVVSWIALRGRCRTCGVWIGWRYPVVELAVGGVWAVTVWQEFGESFAHLLFYGWPWKGICLVLLRLTFLWLLFSLATLDAEHLWLPDWLTLPGIALGFFNAAAQIFFAERIFVTNHGSLYVIGVLVGSCVASAALVLFIRWTYWLIRHREGMGLGDAKLMAMLGAWLGLDGALLSFAIGVLLGAVVGIIVLLRGGRGKLSESAATRLPFGTFLCIGGIVSALWGQPIIAAYLRFVGL